MVVRVQGLGSQGLGFRVSGVRCRDWALGCAFVCELGWAVIVGVEIWGSGFVGSGLGGAWGGGIWGLQYVFEVGVAGSCRRGFRRRASAGLRGSDVTVPRTRS